MNKHLRNVLTISATTLMMLGISGIVSHAHTHACTTAFNEVSSSPDMVASYIQKAETYDSGHGDNDAYSFLNNNNGQPKLFNHYYLKPCDEQQYKIATVGHLADYMNGDPEDYATNSNKNNIVNSLNQKEMTIYNDELYHDGAQLNTHIIGSSYSDNVPLTTDHDTLAGINYINKQINDAEEYDSGNGDSDAYNFLNNDSGNTALFNHSYSNPKSEKEYQLATIGHLADYMNGDPEDYATDANKNNIQQALTSDQLTIYNIRLGEDGAQLNTYINQSPYQYATSNNNNEANSTSNISFTNSSDNSNETPSDNNTSNNNHITVTPHKHAARRSHVIRHSHYYRHARHGHFVHGHYIKYQYGYFNKRGRWVKYRNGHYNKHGKWIFNHKNSKRNKRHVSKRRSRRMSKRSYRHTSHHSRRHTRRY